VSNQISTSINTTSGVDADGNVIRTVSTFAENNPNLSRFAMGFVSGITGAYIRHGITNNEINFRDVAADSVGNTLADEIVGGLSTPTQTSKQLAMDYSLVEGEAQGPGLRATGRNTSAFDEGIRDMHARRAYWEEKGLNVEGLTDDERDAFEPRARKTESK
jgi:hypothetical protein